MNELKVTTKTVHEVEYSELDRFASEVYGRNVEIVPAEEWSNYESHSFDIKKKPFDEYDAERMLNFMEAGKQTFGITRLLLTDMVNNGLIPEGEYLVGIYW